MARIKQSKFEIFNRAVPEVRVRQIKNMDLLELVTTFGITSGHWTKCAGHGIADMKYPPDTPAEQKALIAQWTYLQEQLAETIRQQQGQECPDRTNF